MAVTTNGLHGVLFAGSAAVPVVKTNSRHITREAGRALEILGHAIDYLADEYVLWAGQVSVHDPQVQAIQILMALNREIYYACPLQPTLAERLRAFFHGTPK